MSLIGVLRTGVSGMNAQSNRIATVAENIQNTSTTGYKRVSTEFSSLLLDSADYGNYNSGAVETKVRRAISEGGPVSFTTSSTDLAIQGEGYFAVVDTSGTQYLTRAGNFVSDSSRVGLDNPDDPGTKIVGNHLVNAAGFRLMGFAASDFGADGALADDAKLRVIELPQVGSKVTVDGKALSIISAAIDLDGTVSSVYNDGSRAAIYRIPLAQVPSADQMLPKAGNVFELTKESVASTIPSIQSLMKEAAKGGLGTIKSGALEQSNVDISTELTTMIESQTAYTANSKVFMTGNELLETLMNLKR